MESFKAYVEKIIYRNEDNGYTVLSAEENGCETVCVGVFQFIDEGEYLEFFGEFVFHPSYGEQFKIDHAIGLASDARMRRVEEKEREVSRLSNFIEETPILPSDANALLEQKQTPALQQKVKLLNLLLRPEISLEDMKSISSDLEGLIAQVPDAIRNEVAEEAEILLKYQRYIEKERDVASKILKFEDIALPPDFDYFSLQALSYESREKLTKMKPQTIGQASRISGVSPADVSVLIIYLTRQ